MSDRGDKPVCPTCMGSGTVKPPTWDPTRSAICSSCEGSGKAA